ncbi:deoxyxylulose-5-phosphate synthase [Neorhizobium huautlense]|uniref:Deoxyxylulose-5-phosphate synthase n=1 Tax=Neorhizobium huautlense TaxID=67774 RepID=A0ABT9PXR1_9HYPH|nr:deoxyxylulose-5-phosphate synthase [Neorhizobium huautlense]
MQTGTIDAVATGNSSTAMAAASGCQTAKDITGDPAVA